jgi:hypothetical protein
MRKKLLIICGLFFLAACGEPSDLSNNNKQVDESSESKEPIQYSSEELLGKTLEEFELFKKEQNEPVATKAPPSQPEAFVNNGFLELSWDDLVAPGYDADSIMEKYDPLIDKLEHGSKEALALYEKMDNEFSNAPANAVLADKKVSIPGFIAPLEQFNGMITEFLLVPYFGACIHLPPPPSNQTLYIKVAPDYEIRNEDAYEPIWVSGELNISDTSTEIGSASYQIQNALISKYE